MEQYIIVILTILIVMSFIIGYILGKVNNQSGGVSNSGSESVSFFKQQKEQGKTEKQLNIDIDTKKVVVPIKTEDLEKKYNSLGETSSSQENITSSINKLKSMKG